MTEAMKTNGTGDSGTDCKWSDVPHEDETWELNMRRAATTTDEERRKDDRMFADKFTQFTVHIEEVDTVLGGSAPVEMTVIHSNNHRSAPAVGGTVMKHTDIMAERPEWERVGGA